eukprot:UN11384
MLQGILLHVNTLGCKTRRQGESFCLLFVWNRRSPHFKQMRRLPAVCAQTRCPSRCWPSAQAS